MRKLSIAAGIAAMTVSTAVTAHDTATGYPSRGACEAASFLTRAFTCDRNSSDGLYYITDHIEDVLGSDWFAQRNH